MRSFFQRQEIKNQIKEILIKHGAQYIFEGRDWDSFINFLSDEKTAIGDLRVIDKWYFQDEENMDVESAVTELSQLFYQHRNDLGDFFRVKYLFEVDKKLQNNGKSSLIAFMTFRGIEADPMTFTIGLLDPYESRIGTLISLPSQSSSASCISPTWTPDGKSIFFSSFYRGGNGCGIYKINLVERNVAYVIGDERQIFSDLRLSPSGDYLAYSYVGEDSYKQVGCISMKDNKPKKIEMPYSNTYSCRHPVWKNGSQLYIVYGSKKGSGGGVMLVDLEGRKVIDESINEIHLPSRSEKYLLIIPVKNSGTDYWKLKDQNSGKETLIENILRDEPGGSGIGFNLDNPPSWAPDDEKFVVVRGRDIKDDEVKKLFVYDAKARRDIQLPIDDALKPTWAPSSNFEWNFQPISMTNIGFKKGGCFIASAVYRSELATEVVLLSNFRDRYLSKSLLGRAFIRLYYFVSPSIANLIMKSEALCKITRYFLISPLVGFLTTYFDIKPTHHKD